MRRRPRRVDEDRDTGSVETSLPVSRYPPQATEGWTFLCPPQALNGGTSLGGARPARGAMPDRGRLAVFGLLAVVDRCRDLPFEETSRRLGPAQDERCLAVVGLPEYS